MWEAASEHGAAGPVGMGGHWIAPACAVVPSTTPAVCSAVILLVGAEVLAASVLGIGDREESEKSE